MRHLLTTALALLLCAGCTTLPTPTTGTPTTSAPTPAAPSASPSQTPSGSPTAVAWKDIPVTPKKASAFDVILSDPKLLVLDADEPTGPYMFAVFGNQVLFDDPGDEDVLTYTNGRRTGGAAIDNPDDYVEDLLAHGSELYVLQGDGDTATNRKVHVYHRNASGKRLTPVRVLPGELVAGNAQAWMHFSGPNLVGEAWGDEPVLLDGAGPLTEPTFGQTATVFTVQLPGGQSLRIHTRYGPSSIDLVMLDDDYAYYLAEDYDEDSDSGAMATYVYRMALTAAGSDATYTLAGSPGYEPSRLVQVVDGQVYQLRATNKAVQVLRLHPNP